MRFFKKNKISLILLMLLTMVTLQFVSSYATKNDPLLTPSGSLPSYQQDRFADYVTETSNWLAENRAFVSDNHELEVTMNSPFEVQPKTHNANTPSKGVLLVHGLSDSPGYFRELAEDLSQQGFLVRSILLPGHGSRPADLIDITFDDWTGVVKHHIALLQKEVDNVWLGGFSTGANLVTAYALENEADISGLLLFSPAFESSEIGLAFAPLASTFRTWLDHDEQDGNILRYQSMPTNGAAQYYQSTKQVQRLLANNTFSKPVLMLISQADSVVEAVAIPKIFSKNFTHPNSRLMWFGAPYQTDDKRVVSLPSNLPEQRIGSIAHLSLLFSIDNSYYGKNSDYTMWENEQSNTYNPDTDELWYGAWGHTEPGKYFARLTWNPYYQETLEAIKQVTEKDKTATAQP